MAKVVKAPVSSFSPYYGCFIMAAAVLLFAFMVGWSGYTLLKQNAELDKITVAQPPPFPAATLSPEDQGRLEAKWRSVRESVAAGQPARIDLSLAELNAIIALTPDLGNGSYADLVRITGTDPARSALVADVHLPINPLPFADKPKRYLVGRAWFLVEVQQEGPDARIVDLEVPGKPVPDGFIQTQELWTWVTPYRQDAALATTLKALRHVQVTAAGVTLATQADAPPAATPQP